MTVLSDPVRSYSLSNKVIIYPTLINYTKFKVSRSENNSCSLCVSQIPLVRAGVFLETVEGVIFCCRKKTKTYNFLL